MMPQGEAALAQITLDDAQLLHRLQLRRKVSIRATIAGVGLLVLLTEAAPPPLPWIGTAMEAAGLLAIALCILGRAWCALYIGGRKSIELVEVGPYSVSRNPLYWFSGLGALGVALLTGSWTLAAAALLALPLIFLPVIRAEELVLRRTFQSAFDAYCARVPRIGPRLRLWRDAPNLDVEPLHLYRVVRDSMAFALALPCLGAIAWLHAQQILPVLLRLP